MHSGGGGGTCICHDMGCAIILGTFWGAPVFLGTFLGYYRIFGYYLFAENFICLGIIQIFGY